jgi:hypothetical protein
MIGLQRVDIAQPSLLNPTDRRRENWEARRSILVQLDHISSDFACSHPMRDPAHVERPQHIRERAIVNIAKDADIEWQVLK